MSRSNKRSPVCKQRNSPFAKRWANKRVRKSEVQSGKAYKKLFCSYDICDWWWWEPRSKKEFAAHMEKRPYTSEEDWEEYFDKHHKRK